MYSLTATPPATSGPLAGPIQPVPYIPSGKPQPDSPPPIGVATPFKTSLQLTPERQAWLLDRIRTRIDEVASEMGRDSDGRVRWDSWMGLRDENQRSYRGDLEWRKAHGTVFQRAGSNFSVEDDLRYVRLLSARERNDLLGTRPFFGCMTTDYGDAELTKDVEHYAQLRVDESNLGPVFRDAITIANVVNEATIKFTYLKREDPFTGPVTVMVDARGLPRLTTTGDYIYPNDDIVPDQSVQNLMVLVKDPNTKYFLGEGQYQRFSRLPQKRVVYDNVWAEVLDFRDFLCPLRSATTEEADINVHLYEKSVEELRRTYPNIELADNYFSRIMSPQTGAMQPVRTQGEREWDEKSTMLRRLLIGEVYIRCDADEDGVEEEIMAVVDLTNTDMVFYDYLANHMNGRPFCNIPGVKKEAGRWFGIGVMGDMRKPMLYVDAQFNRINEKDSQNASVTWFHQDASEQWRDGEPFSPGSEDAIAIRPQWPPNQPICGRTNLQADAELGMELMNDQRKGMALKFGVISGQDASANDLNQSKTATGVMSVERDAGLISQDIEQDMSKAFEDGLWIAIDLLFENMPPSIMFFRPGGQTLVSLNRDEVRSLPRKVRLLLTKTRSAERLATNEKAEAIWLRYMNLTPPQQFRGRPLYVNQLKGLEVDDVDDLLPEVTQQEADAWQQQQAQAAANAQKPPAKSISTKYTDLLPSERRQLLLQEGIQPGNPQEEAQQDAHTVDLAGAKKAAETAAVTANSPPPPKPAAKK